jgi:hypothetical protein
LSGTPLIVAHTFSGFSFGAMPLSITWSPGQWR